jgi:hypothetical protein
MGSAPTTAIRTRRGDRTASRSRIFRCRIFRSASFPLRFATPSFRQSFAFAGTYTLGYSIFAVLMFLWLFSKDGRETHFEVLYSWAGLVAKLGLVLSELCVFKDNEAGADAVLGLTVVFSAAIIGSGLRFMLRGRRGNIPTKL